MNLSFVPLSSYGLDPAAAVLARGFEDYFIKLACTSAWLLHTARNDSVDLAASRVVLEGNRPVGAALIARRGWTSRLAGMTLVPEARGRGVGRATMEHLLAAARDREERAMGLEVICDNTVAEKLYARCGFERVRRLVSFSHPGFTPAAPDRARAERLERIDPRRLGAAVTRWGLPDLPWQLSGETLAHLTPPSLAYRGDGVWVAVVNVNTPEPVIRMVLTEGQPDDARAATEILRAVMAKHPAKTWRVSALWPEELAEVFLSAGFVADTLAQWQMARALP